MTCKNSSLELRWLPQPKQIPLPVIVWCNESASDYLGAYWHPNKKEVVIGGKYYPCDKGIIELCHDDYEATLAHEFRHHIQYFSWRKPDIGRSWVDIQGSYKDRIVQYFTGSITELDALLFEVRHYPDDCNQERLEWVIKHYEGNG